MCENQQALENLLTRATTLASMTFHTLMAITVKFDLKTVQMNAVNIFMNCMLDEVVYMKQSFRFEKGNTVLHLQKTLYRLKQSLLL